MSKPELSAAAIETLYDGPAGRAELMEGAYAQLARAYMDKHAYAALRYRELSEYVKPQEPEELEDQEAALYWQGMQHGLGISLSALHNIMGTFRPTFWRLLYLAFWWLANGPRIQALYKQMKEARK